MTAFRALAAPLRACLLVPILALLATITTPATPMQAAALPLSELSRYLNTLGSAETDFTQINPDGSVSTGRIIINRPGKVRFEYAPPDRSLVLSDGQMVAVFDPKSNQPPEQYPLSRTPLNLILGRDIDLSRARMVTRHREDGATTRVTAQDPQHPQYGTIEMVFSANPTTLRQWIITDDSGSRTTMILGDLRKTGAMSSNLFDIDREAVNRGLKTDR